MPDQIVLAKHAGSDCAVGVFDSGVGGLSVLQHIRQRLPNEALIYFADSGFAPYGDKSDEAIIERSLAVAEFLLQHQIKALVIACNTATAAAVATLRLRYPELIIVGIEPGLKPAALHSKAKVVGVLATKSTLHSQKFKQLRDQLSAETGVQFVLQACVGLVNQIEKAELHSADTLQLVRRYVAPLMTQGADTLVLGCTHYPFVADLIRQVVAENHPDPDSVRLIDTGEAVARRLQKLLEQQGLLNTRHSTEVLRACTTGSPASLAHALLHMLALREDQYLVSALV
ncbi:MAG: glutamate racemase [Undibacterium sp.]|uniref:glutamate racemase n=1 Tax=Undibacterium sp. TaxID=1914977 RepID=UPI0027284137|nr:glutamate racemase [Undibacterium sp.]MDO8650578.1 glutamate racemase [Undibacterium sp.]